MKIMIVTDAWRPQINGVVRSLEATIEGLSAAGHEVLVAAPGHGSRLALGLPTYPDIRIDLAGCLGLAKKADAFGPDRIHIATEGPMGWAMRHHCRRRGLPFTTAYHTRFPEYIAARCPGFLRGWVTGVAYAVLRHFHRPAAHVLVATASMERELAARGFIHLALWSRGVDAGLFRPYGKDHEAFRNLPRPILLYVGRVAPEKNLPEFLALRTQGTKVVIGDGPARAALQQDYPQAVFMGEGKGEDLARLYAAADLFVFPSKTDTFGMVVLEACAAGLRVAACNAPGPRDILLGDAARRFSVLDDNLQQAVERALALPEDPAVPRRFVEENFGWDQCTRQFEEKLGPRIRYNAKRPRQAGAVVKSFLPARP